MSFLWGDESKVHKGQTLIPIINRTLSDVKVKIKGVWDHKKGKS